jgi:hypothetical protein
MYNQLTIYTNNMVSISNRRAGRIHKDDSQPMKTHRPVRFFTMGGVEHQIDVPIWVGGPSDWRINDDFALAVSEIVNNNA